MDRREIEASSQDFHQLLSVVGDAAAGSAEGKAGTNEDGEPELVGEVEAVAQVVDQRGPGNVKADADHRILEEQAVFSFLDGFELGADQLHVVAVENAGVSEIDGEVESGLAADSRQKREFAGIWIRRKHLRFNADN